MGHKVTARFSPARVLPFVILCLAAAVFVLAYPGAILRPVAATAESGWWTWADQGHYLMATQALARFDLAPAQHWYEPAYPLLGAPFVRLTPTDPFLIPDLAAYLAACLLFGALGARLLTIGRWGRPLGMALFLAATASSAPALAIWIVPWTTTAVMPLLLAALLAALRFTERPTPARAFLVTLCACAVGLFRPGEALVVVAPAAVLMAWTLRHHRPAIPTIVIAGLAGAVLPLAAGLAMHAAIWGWHLGPYLESLQRTGFAWPLLPLRWVLLVVGPQPLIADGAGLAQVFVWVIPGIAGMAACLVAPGRLGRAPHALIILTAVLEGLMLLAYRDLHPTGLWRFSNYHYFKWLIPLAALYAALLVQALLDRTRRIPVIVAGLVASVALFGWHARLDPQHPALHASTAGPQRIALQTGTAALTDGLLIAANGQPDAIGQGYYIAIQTPDPADAARIWQELIHEDHRHASLFHAYNETFKMYPQPGGLLLVPLRSLPAGLLIAAPATVTFDPGVTPIGVTQRIAFGLPCWFDRCTTPALLPGWPLPPGRKLALGEDADRFLGAGWSVAQPDGRWTVGDRAAALFRVSGPDLTLHVDGHAFLPTPTSDPLRITVLANGHPVADWRIPPGPDPLLEARIPAAAVDLNGSVQLEFRIANPRSPAEAGLSADPRPLGLFVRSLTLRP